MKFFSSKLHRRFIEDGETVNNEKQKLFHSFTEISPQKSILNNPIKSVVIMARIHPSSITTGEYKRIMVYSHDTFGLGNIRRMLAICKYLLKSIPNLSILLVSGSPMLPSFRLPIGLDYIKLPCLNRGQSGKMAVKYLNADIESILQLRSELILAAAKNYQPDLVLVDKKPSGIQGELNSTIDYLKVNLPATKFVLLLRDILDTPEKTIREWQREGY